MEIWKDVVGYEGLYMVSSIGRVKACEKADQRGHVRKEKYLKPCKSGDKNSYQALKVRLCKNGIGKMSLVHRLVALAFIPNPDNFPEVNHKDENPFNNMVWVNDDGSVNFEKSNLEWCTHKYNTTYGTARARAGQKNSVKLKNRPDHSKWVIKCSKDNEILHFYPSTMEAERETGIKRTAIGACCRGKKVKDKDGRYYVPKTAGGYIWKYAE